MKKFIGIILLCAMVLTACAVKGPTGEEVTLKSSAEILEEIKGNYFSNDAIEKFRETKSAMDSFEGLYVMRIDETEVMVGDGHQGASVGEIGTSEDTGNGIYTIEAKKDDNNYFNASYYAEDKMMVSNFKTDFSGDSEEQYVKYKKFNSDEEIVNELTGILFENAEGVNREEGSVFAEVDGVKYEMKVSYSTAETGVIRAGKYQGSIMLKGGGKIIGGAYKVEDGKIIIADANGEIMCSFDIK